MRSKKTSTINPTIEIIEPHMTAERLESLITDTVRSITRDTSRTNPIKSKTKQSLRVHERSWLWFIVGMHTGVVILIVLYLLLHSEMQLMPLEGGGND